MRDANLARAFLDSRIIAKARLEESLPPEECIGLLASIEEQPGAIGRNSLPIVTTSCQ
jgi:hypothetical protein